MATQFVKGPKGFKTQQIAKEPDQTDIVESIIGPFGKYQFAILFFILIQKVPMACLQQSVVFMAPKVSYICEDTGNQTCPCKNPIYDRSIFINTIIMEWDLICDRKWLNSLLQTLFYAGMLVGSLLSGISSDRFGRKWPYLLSTTVQVLAGVASYFATNYWAFASCRFILGATVGGVISTSFVIIMEFIGKAYRNMTTIVFVAFFCLGYMLMPAVGYFFTDFNDFQLAISLSSVLFPCYVFFLPETPRWLIATKKTESAIKLLERIAYINNRPTDGVRLQVDILTQTNEKKSQRKGTLSDLFRTPNLRKNILAMAFNWFSASYCFYGVTQYVGQLAGNIFFNVWLIATLILIGTLSSIPLLKVLGRRTIFILMNSTSAVCLLVLSMVPDGFASVAFAILGVMAIQIVFMVAFLYTSELFPTVVRNAAIGFSSMAARMGSMMAPFVIDLQDFGTWAPPIAFAVLPLIAAFVTLLLPETKGCELMTTVEEGESFGKKDEKL